MDDFWETHLHPGETLLWQGAPIPMLRITVGDFVVAALGLVILCFGLGMFFASIEYFPAAETWLDTVMTIIWFIGSLPIVALGGGLTFVFTYAEFMRRRNTRYALSTRCAYIATNWRKFTIDSYPILPNTEVSLDQRKRWYGVTFHARKTDDEDGGITTTLIGFERIADGPKVFRLIRGIQMDTP